MIELIKSFIIGIVEGITEWLPVSSTGHMIILNQFLKLDVSEAFFTMYEVVIQFGAALAVVLIFFRKLFSPVLPRISSQHRKSGLRLWLKIIISCLPAAVIGLLFDDKIDEIFFNAPTVASALILYGVIFIIIEFRRKGIRDERGFDGITYKDALIIGVFQLLSLIPGTSRSGATIIGAMLLGFTRGAAAEYTFFLAVPVMFGAGILKLVKFGFDFTSSELSILAAGFSAAFVISIICIRFLMSFVKRHSFTGFGFYRIALGIAVFILLILGVFGGGNGTALIP